MKKLIKAIEAIGESWAGYAEAMGLRYRPVQKICPEGGPRPSNQSKGVFRFEEVFYGDLQIFCLVL